jgi:hypothetical protein
MQAAFTIKLYKYAVGKVIYAIYTHAWWMFREFHQTCILAIQTEWLMDFSEDLKKI